MLSRAWAGYGACWVVIVRASGTVAGAGVGVGDGGVGGGGIALGDVSCGDEVAVVTGVAPGVCLALTPADPEHPARRTLRNTTATVAPAVLIDLTIEVCHARRPCQCDTAQRLLDGFQGHPVAPLDIRLHVERDEVLKHFCGSFESLSRALRAARER